MCARRGSIASYEAMRIFAEDGSFEMFLNDCAAFASKTGSPPGQAVAYDLLGERGINMLKASVAAGAL